MPELLKLEKILPIFQVIEKVDGDGKVTHSVLGVATSEVEDKDGEIADYEGTNAQIKVWSDDFLQKTSASGQELSLGNIRVQHDPKQIGGKVTAIDPNEAKKQIVINTQPRDSVYDDLIFPGYVTGFSIAGSYLSRKCNDCGSDIDRGKYCTKCNKAVKVRYVPSISEISYVDNPCNPDAGFIHVKASGAQELVKFNDLRKAAETAADLKKKQDQPTETETAVERVLIRLGVVKAKKTKRVDGEDLHSGCFAYVGDAEDPKTWKLPYKCFSTDEKNKSHVRNALARFSQTKGIPADEKAKVKAKLEAAAKKHGIEVSDDSAKAVRAAVVRLLAEQSEVAEKLMLRIDEVFTKAAPEAPLFKGLYTVGSLAQVMQDLQWIVASTAYERDYEGDESEVPDDLRSVLEDLIPVFVAMATEEANELLEQTNKTANGGNGGNNMSKLSADLLKAAQDLWKKASSHFHKMSKAHGALAKAHTKASDHHEAAADHLSGDGAMGKGMAKAHAGLHKVHVTKSDHYSKLADHHAAAAEDAADKAAKDELQKLAEGAEFKKLDPDAQFEKRMDVIIEKGGGCAKCFSKMAKGHAAISKLHKSLSGKHDDMNKAAIALGDEEEAIDMQGREEDDDSAHPGGSSEKTELIEAINGMKKEFKDQLDSVTAKVDKVQADVDKVAAGKLDEGPLEKAKREQEEKDKADKSRIHLEDHDKDDPSKKSTIKTEKTAGSAQGAVGVFA